ncbi:MAG TPA: MFS transporter [Hyphomicrobiaceae bacterium]|nr:MFS transporter [Hyphomicrobiaceae bacterium]
MQQHVPARERFHTGLLTRFESVLILSSAAVMLSIAMGLRQSLGLFQTPVVQDLGLQAADYAMAVAVQNIVWGVTQPFAGALVDRFGPRAVAIFGAITYAIGLAVTATATSAEMIMLGTGLLVGVALSCSTSGIAANVAARVIVPSRRSLGFGIVSAAGSIGTFFAAPLGQAVLQAGGWRAALSAFLALSLLMLPAAFLAGRAGRLPNSTAADKDLTLGAALGEAGRHSGYVVMSLAFFVCGLQLIFLTTHLPSYLALCGMDPMLGAQALAVIGLFNVIGSWGFGWLGDRYSKRMLLGGIYIARSLFMAAYFMLPVTPTSTLIFAALMGLTWLGVIPLLNGLVVQMFGIKFLSTLTGIAFFSHQVGSFLGAWGGGAIYDALGSYDRALQAGVIVGLIAGFAQLLAHDRPTQRLAAEAKATSASRALAAESGARS